MRASWTKVVGVVAAMACAATAFAGSRTGPAQAGARTEVWTAQSATSLFPDSLPSEDGGGAIALDTARNEFEAGQIAVRRSTPFTIRGVSFSALRDRDHEISTKNLSYNFVKYESLNHNSVFGGNQWVYAPVRPAPGLFPEGLSNAKSTSVAANTTQPIWVRVYVPKNTPAGTYRGSARVQTDHGDLVVPLSVSVRAVTIPDTKDSDFTNVAWTLFFGTISWQEPPVETMLANYGYSPYTPKWWQLMEDYAKLRKDYRINDLTLPTSNLLIQGGTTVDADGKVDFDWSTFDQVAKFFMDRGTVSRLEGFWVNGGPNYWTKWDVETLARDANGKSVKKYVPWDSPEADSYITQYVTALRDHIKAKGWENIWWMHVGDEPQGDIGRAGWTGIAQKIRAIWPDVKLGDATFHDPVASELSMQEDITIPGTLNYQWAPQAWDKARAAGKDMWLYAANIPTQGYLNRFVDQPQWYSRATGWLESNHNANGNLNWAFNNWNISMDDQDVKGDYWMVQPDKERNLIERSTRLESQRDGIEDWEVLNILKAKNPDLAADLSKALVTDLGTFSADVEFMQRIRGLVLDAAAGKPIAGRELAALARDGRSVDLGSQQQVDGVYVRWGASHPANYTIQTSYDGVSWVDAAKRTGSNGGEDYVGIDGKARYVRLIADSGELKSFKVTGFALPRPNLVGGRTYTKSWTPPTRFPDSTGLESTDGVISDNFSDGRPYVIQGGPGETKSFDVSFDLGARKTVREVDVQGYVEFAGYRPDTVHVLTSDDGEHWTDRGGLVRPNDASGNRFKVRFDPVTAQHVKVAFTRTFTKDADGVFLDDIEVY